MMRGPSAWLTAATIIVVAAGCPGSPPINPITTTVDPQIVTLAVTQGGVDPVNTCTPASPAAPPAPDQWWNGLAPTQPPRVAGQGVVGFDLWRNQTDGCQEFRQDLYRTAFSYDLAQLQSLKGLITSAELSVSVAVMPAVPPGSMCMAMIGGGGSLLMLQPGTALPQASFAALQPPATFPTGGQVFALPTVWIDGQVAPGVTALAAGGGRGSFTVNVTDRLNGALNRGDASMAFALSGSDETRPTTPPPDRFDCRTTYQIGQLVVKHL